MNASCLKQIEFLSRRGILELDLILAKFINHNRAYVEQWAPDFITLLKEPDWVLLDAIIYNKYTSKTHEFAYLCAAIKASMR